MNKSGFIRKSLLLLGFLWLYHELFVARSPVISDPDLKRLASWALMGMTGWAILTLFLNRLQR